MRWKCEYAWMAIAAALGVFGCSERPDAGPDAASTVQPDGGGDAGSGKDAAVAVGDIGPCGDGLGLCDIREAKCQASIGRVVACLRESLMPMPPVRLLSEAEYVELLERRPDGGANAVAAAIMTQRWLAGLALFGLAEEGTASIERTKDHAGRIGAVYLYATRDIAVIDRGMPFDDEVAVTTLAHEIVHAQQDQERDLMAWGREHSSTDDRALAATAVIEGEATHYEEIVRIALRGDALEGYDWAARYGEWQADRYQKADREASAYGTAIIYFPYAFGGELVTERWLEDGPAGVAALFDRPPRSTHEILFESGGEPEAADALLPAAAAPIQQPYAPVAFNQLGSWLVRAFLRRVGLSEDAALAAAGTVGSDMISVQIDTDDATPIAGWRMQLLPGADTSWLDQILPPSEVSWSVDDDQVTFVSAPPEQADYFFNTPWLEVPPPP